MYLCIIVINKYINCYFLLYFLCTHKSGIVDSALNKFEKLIINLGYFHKLVFFAVNNLISLHYYNNNQRSV